MLLKSHKSSLFIRPEFGTMIAFYKNTTHRECQASNSRKAYVFVENDPKENRDKMPEVPID